MRRQVVIGIGQDQQVEALVRLHQRIDQRNGVSRMDVVVHVSMDQEQLAFEVRGGRLVGRGLVVVGLPHGIANQEALEPFTPARVVGPVVVIARGRHRRFVEIGVPEQRAGRGKPAARVPVDPDPVEVELGHPDRQLLDCGEVIGDPVVAHVAVPGRVEGLGPPGVAEGVDRHDNEPELGHRLDLAGHRIAERIAARVKGLDRRADQRPGVDVVEHWILLGRIEPARLPDHAPDVGDAVPRLGREDLARPPAGGYQILDVGPLDLRKDSAVAASNHGHRRLADGRVAVDKELARRHRGDLVVHLFG